MRKYTKKISDKSDQKKEKLFLGTHMKHDFVSSLEYKECENKHGLWKFF